jgi:hypothetical protein
MIILNNLLNSQDIYLRLGDKITNTALPLILILTRIEDKTVVNFSITNTSTSPGIYKFTIDPSVLGSSDYSAAVYEGLPDADFEDCEILINAQVEVDSDSDCNPLLLEAILTLDAMLVLGEDPPETLIWTGRCRVQGQKDFTYQAPIIEPTYIVYEG